MFKAICKVIQFGEPSFPVAAHGEGTSFPSSLYTYLMLFWGSEKFPLYRWLTKLYVCELRRDMAFPMFLGHL